MSAQAWTLLGLPPGADERSVKRAYAALLKKTRPEDDAAAYQALREAYEQALAQARHAATHAVEVETTAVGDPADVAQDADPANGVHDQVPAGRAITEQEARALAWQKAGMLWQEFLATAKASPRTKLERLCGGASILSLLEREALEVMAVRWCAAEEADPELHEAVIDYFGWAIDHRHLERLDGDTVHHALARQRAYRAFVSLRANGSVHLTRALLSRQVPRFSLNLLNGAFIREMRQVVQQVRWNAPELLHFHLDRTVFEWWEQRVMAPRVTLQSLMLSLLAGLVLFGATALLLPAEDESLWWRLLGCEIVAVLAGIWVSLKSANTVARLARFKADYFERPLYGEHYKLARYGWLAPFTLLSLVLFVPEPGEWLQFVAMVGMLACAGWALFAASLVLTPVGYALSAVVAWLLGGFVHRGMFPQHAVLTALAFAVCLHSLLTTHAMRAHDLPFPPARLWHLRMAWLAGAAALFTAQYAAVPEFVTLVLWLWVLAGAIIGAFSVSPLLALPVYLAAAIAAAPVRANVGAAGHARLLSLESLLLVIMVYTALSMWQKRDRNA